MPVELINKITIKKDGVYVSTHSSNDTAPYTSSKIEFLTKIYNENGQKGLDKKIIDLYFDTCVFRGTHKSIMPYKNAINKAKNDKEFIKIDSEYRNLYNKVFSISRRCDEYKNLTKEESEKMYSELKPKLKKLKDKRIEFVANLVEKEKRKINGPKEIAKGIYEVIPQHTTHKKIGEIYQEYMNFNSNNGTIIYSLNLSSLMPTSKPDIIKISDYLEMINKYGIDKVNGANKFKKFIMKYPDIYKEGISNENEQLLEEEENEI